MDIVYLIPLFFLTALVYSIAGFGGASTYLALLVLFGYPYASMPQIALLCNLAVVGGGLFHFIRMGLVDLRRLVPFVAASVPLAYLGGRLVIPEKWFLFLLGLSLATAGLRLFFDANHEKVLEKSAPKFANSKKGSGNHAAGIRLFSGWSAALGGGIGFLSGVVGIGGGIFLAPALYFLKWGSARHIAAASCFFIFVNSLSGLLGQLAKNPLPSGDAGVICLVAAVFLGGQIGSRLSSGRLPLWGLKRITAILILSVSTKILWNL